MDARKQIDQFRQSLTIEDCVKSNVPQLFALQGESNGGKSVTAMILAIGLVGPEKPIGVIDGENRRSGWAADIALDMAQKHYGKRPPNPIRIPMEDCHPLAVVAAIEELLKRGCGAIIADCMTACWETYLDLKEQALERMAGDDWKKRERAGMAASAQTKPWTHGVLVRTLRTCPVHAVLCFRGKKRVVMGKDESGKTRITQDPFSTPVQESGLIFDCLIAGEVVAHDGVGGYCLWTGPNRKVTHPDVLKLLPTENEQFHFRHAEALAKWASGAGVQKPIDKPSTPPLGKQPSNIAKLKGELWALLQPIHLCEKDDAEEVRKIGRGKVNQHLVDEGYISDTEAIESLTETRITEVIAKLKATQTK